MSQYIHQFLNDAGIPFVIARMAVILLCTFILAKLFRALFRKTGSKHRIHQRFLCNMLIVLLWVVGAIMAVSQLNWFTQGFSALLAGSGIAALAISLAAQGSLGNAIDGMFISMFRPFEVGDRVRVINGNITGFVEDITLRHTVIRTFMNSRIIIPNSTVNKDMIENSTFWNVKASGFIDVTITYESDVDHARELMAQIIGNHPDFVDPRDPKDRTGPKVNVFVRALSLYGVELRASLWTDSVNNNFAACSDVRAELLRVFAREGIKIAHSKLIDPMIGLES